MNIRRRHGSFSSSLAGPAAAILFPSADWLNLLHPFGVNRWGRWGGGGI